MTEPTPEPVTDVTAVADDAPDVADDGGDSGDEIELPKDIEAAKKLRNEAANLRKRNRELEEVNERLLTQAQATQRREIERAAAEVLIDASDVWRIDSDTQQSWYDTEFNEVVPDAVRDSARALASAKPHLAKPPTAPPPTDRPIEGLRGGASPEVKKVETTWASALRRSI